MDNKSALHHIALIPAYKPLKLLPDLVCKLSENGIKVVIVNDGSGDEFNDIFEKCSQYADICVHKINMGKGAALKTGLGYIYDRYGEESVIVTVDADGQHAIKDALAILSTAEVNPHTLVFGSRKFTGKVPFRSRIGNELTEIAYDVFSGVKMCDTQTGLRAFTGDLIPDLLNISGQRYEYEINMLFGFTKKRIKIIEHEIETIYLNDNSSSHFHPIRDTLRLHWQIFKASSYSHISIAVEYILFALIWLISDKLIIANAVSKSVSALLRFILNRKFGFAPQKNALRSAIKYVFISLGIIVLNTTILYIVITFCSVPPLLSKLIIILFGYIISWIVKKLTMHIRRAKK